MPFKKALFAVLFALLALAFIVLDYITLPAWNLHSFDFWVLLAIAIGAIIFLAGNLLGLKRSFFFGLCAGLAVFAVALVASAGSWLLWPGNSARYFGQLSVTEADSSLFAKDFPDSPVRTGTAEQLILPMTDKELSIVTAQGKLGSYGARFRIDTSIFSAISINRGGACEIVRVSPLDYTTNIVALSAGSRGTAGYIEVNQLTEEGTLVPVEGGMKFTPGAVLSRDLDRKLRFAHRSFLYGQKSFEIDDSGHPWWVVPVMQNTIGLFGGADQKGTVILDPVTGKDTYYEKGLEPSWVDRAIPASTLITQANNYLRLKDGWINAVFGEKKDVFQLSDSYNYVVSSGLEGAHTWLISGVTSPSESDQTMVGFMMINLKTKESRWYHTTGITEMRAMEIAQNDERVRAQSLEATWPIITELSGEAAYYLFLKNNVQRQRFVYIDVATGHKVAMGETLAAARLQFAQLHGAKSATTAASENVTGTVLRVRSSDKDSSILFILSEDRSTLYTVDPELSNGVRFLSPGDRVQLSYRDISGSQGRRFVSELKNLSLEE